MRGTRGYVDNKLDCADDDAPTFRPRPMKSAMESTTIPIGYRWGSGRCHRRIHRWMKTVSVPCRPNRCGCVTRTSPRDGPPTIDCAIPTSRSTPTVWSAAMASMMTATEMPMRRPPTVTAYADTDKDGFGTGTGKPLVKSQRVGQWWIQIATTKIRRLPWGHRVLPEPITIAMVMRTTAPSTALRLLG